MRKTLLASVVAVTALALVWAGAGLGAEKPKTPAKAAAKTPAKDRARKKEAAPEAPPLVLNHPQGIGYDAAGQLLVADTGNHRVLVFSPDLTLVRTIGSEGDGPGQFRSPTDVAVDGEGRIVVVDSGNRRVQVFTAEGSPVLTFGKAGEADDEFRAPTKVTVDENGHFLVTDTGGNRLQVFDRTGKHVFTLANRTGPIPDDLLQPDKDGKKTPKDWERTDAGQFNEPGGIFYDRALRRLFVANGWNCRAEVLDYDSATGEIRRRAGKDGIVWGWWVTRGIDGDAQGRLIGCDTGHGALNLFDHRETLTSESQRSAGLAGGAYGAMRDVTDVAVAPSGDIAVADAGNSRVLVFNGDLRMPSSPRVKRAGRKDVVITYETVRPGKTGAMIRAGGFPERTPGHESPWDAADVRRVGGKGADTTQHELRLTGLEPGTKHFYRLESPDMRCIPDGGWSREYAVTTEAPKGRTAFVRLPVKVLLLANVVNLDTAVPGVPMPEPMTAEEIELYRRDFVETQRFYWCNSSMRYWLDFDLYVDETTYRVGKDRTDLDAAFMQLPPANENASFKTQIEKAGKQDVVYAGTVVCTANRVWEPNRKVWVYQGSGGGTYGINWPTPGYSGFLGGSDIAWLMCHEYHHQFESQYGASGLDHEDDRVIFCHFAPQYPGWDWCTAYKHGEHWDGIAYDLRHLTAEQYGRNLYGSVETAVDADEDGLPDDDARLPLDEKRFHSDPSKRDTDGDGLSDMGEVLASQWVTCLNADLRTKTPGRWARPDPQNPDSDGDGIVDGDDPYPIYPFPTEIARGTAQVDGRRDEWTGPPAYSLDHAGAKLRAWVRWDERYLYYAFEIEGPWAGMTFVVDQNADGFFVGGDNVYAEFVPDEASGARKANVRMHYCNLGRWPWFDDQHEFIKPEVYPFASSRADGKTFFEFALPRNEACGLNLGAGKTVSVSVILGLPGRGPISLFEPWHFFDATMVDAVKKKK